MMKKVLQRLIIITSCAFLIVTISFTILPSELVPEVISAKLLQQTLGICIGAAFAAELSTKYSYKKVWTSFLCPYLAVSFTVFFIGSVVFDVITMNVKVFSSVSMTICVIYIIVYYTIFEMNKNDAKEINRQLQKKHKERDM